MPGRAAGDGPGRTRCISEIEISGCMRCSVFKDRSRSGGGVLPRAGTTRLARRPRTIALRGRTCPAQLSGRLDQSVASRTKRRLPTCRTRPSSVSLGRSRRSGVDRLAVDPDAALGDQAARLAAADAERLASRTGRWTSPVRARSDAARDVLRDARGPDVDLVEARLRRRRRCRRRGSGRRSAGRSSRLASFGCRDSIELARRAGAGSTAASPRRGRSSACRTSPPAARSRRRSCRATCSSSGSRRCRAGSASS